MSRLDRIKAICQQTTPSEGKLRNLLEPYFRQHIDEVGVADRDYLAYYMGALAISLLVWCREHSSMKNALNELIGNMLEDPRS